MTIEELLDQQTPLIQDLMSDTLLTAISAMIETEELVKAVWNTIPEDWVYTPDDTEDQPNKYDFVHQFLVEKVLETEV